MRHLELTQDNNLPLYDRGYYAYWFFLEHTLRERAFCLRLRRNANKQIKAFSQSNIKQAIITLNPSEGMCQQAREKGLTPVAITVRLIRIKIQKEYYILITNLTNKKAYTRKDFYALYYARWRVKKGYKVQKSFLEVVALVGKLSIVSSRMCTPAYLFTHTVRLLALPVTHPLRR